MPGKVDRQSRIIQLAYITCIFFAITITSGKSTYYPYSVLKLMFLSGISFGLTSIVIYNIKEFRKFPKWILFWTALWVLWTNAIPLLTDYSFEVQVYGYGNRFVGLLTMSCLALILCGTILLSSVKIISDMHKCFFLVGVISVFMGLIQSIGIDPFNPYVDTQVFGTYGNINFQSSIIGMCAIAFIGQIKALRNLQVLCYVALFSTANYIIYKSTSIQGFFVFAIGLATLFLIYMLKSKHLLIRLIVTFIYGLISLLSLLAFIQQGLSGQITTLDFRFEYYKAGLKMFFSNFFFGVGHDSFYDHYFRYRDLDSVPIGRDTISASSSHSYFIDLAAQGGVFYVSLYLFLIFMTLRAYIKIYKREVKIQLSLAIIFCIWISYQVQSFISVFSISVLVIGWITSGLIIGYEIKSRKNSISSNLVITNIYRGKTKFYIGMILGLLLTTPPLIANVSFQQAIKSQSVESISSNSLRFPTDPEKIAATISFFTLSNYHEKAYELNIIGVRKFPDSYMLWNLLSNNRMVSRINLDEANTNMKRLKPT
jgi:hypothetical protein